MAAVEKAMNVQFRAFHRSFIDLVNRNMFLREDGYAPANPEHAISRVWTRGPYMELDLGTSGATSGKRALTQELFQK